MYILRLCLGVIACHELQADQATINLNVFHVHRECNQCVWCMLV